MRKLFLLSAVALISVSLFAQQKKKWQSLTSPFTILVK